MRLDRHSGQKASALQRSKPQPDARVRLLCLPYAGAGASVYRRWHDDMAPEVEVVAVQPPGRENRIRDAAHHCMEALVDELMDAIDGFEHRPLALFGHSFGATVAFELAHVMSAAGQPPTLLAVSGRRPPHEPPYGENSRGPQKLDDASLIARMRELGGTPEEVLEHEELLQLLLPVLRADFTILKRYQPPERPALECPMVVYGGVDDPDVPPAALDAWRRHGAGHVPVERFAGGHFYLDGAAGADLRASLKAHLLAAI